VGECPVWRTARDSFYDRLGGKADVGERATVLTCGSIREHTMKHLEISTKRLLLRPPRLSDVPVLFEFLGDRDAMALTHVDLTLPACRRRIAVHEWKRRHDGYAPWTVIERAKNKIIGWGGLYDDPFDPGWGCEVGYFFHPDAWGCGYASELVAASLYVADNDLKLPQVRAFAHPENSASRKVLEKAGFTITRFVPEMMRLLFTRVGDQSASTRR
jgi:[ribosomal protein S5]-alanine N-acetyltransferase